MRTKSKSDSQITYLPGISSPKGNILEERGRERKMGRERVAMMSGGHKTSVEKGCGADLEKLDLGLGPRSISKTYQCSNVALEAQGCLPAKAQVSLDADI